MANNSSSSHGCNILLLLLSIYLSKLTALFSHATSTLFPNQTITDGESLISPNKTYELGFFSPDGSSNRFVGIWYHNLPVQTVVWVANRERPIPDFSGFITFDSQGNLIVKNGFGSSSVIASNTGMTNLTTIVLLDSGNLILRDWTSSGKGKILWQSFDSPTDTFLPGMKLGVDGRQNRVITSWTSPQDPSPGEFTLGIDPNGTKQFFIWRRGEVYWTSGVWNGEQFRFVSQKAEPYFHYLSYVSNWSGGYYSYYLKDSSIITRAVMDFTGQLKRSAWLEDKWVVFFVQPAMVACEVPDYCGANGLCNKNTVPPCSCLLGFEPNAKDQWDLGSRAGGCKRESLLKCGDGDGFLRLRNVKLPLFYLSTGNSSAGLEDCKAKCSSNCSCTAYALANGNGNGCLLWFGDLMGLQQSSDALQDLYVRLAASELNQASGKSKLSMQFLIYMSSLF